MPIYSLHERVKYFRDIIDIQNNEKFSYENGNMFESMAATNPELFNTYKLKQIANSRSLAEGFNEYFGLILNSDTKKFNEFEEKYRSSSDDEYNEYFYNNFNIAYYGIISRDFIELTEKYSDSVVSDFINRNYLPEGMTEYGIKKLIRIRLLNNKILIDGLIKMLENNYRMLDIDTAEAKSMINKLNNDKLSNEIIGDIKNEFKNPNFLNKFKVGRNYDFRPIGGAYIFLADGVELEGGAPHKYLANIFKYDAIVVGHGSNYKEERLYNPITMIKYKNKYIVEDIMKVFEVFFDEKTKIYTFVEKDTVSRMEDLREYITTYLNSNLSKDDMKNISDRVTAMMNEITKCAEINKNRDQKYELYDIARGFDYYLNAIYSKNNIARTFIDGKSADWIVEPINTINKKNLTHIIDVLRALKNEGFTNILVDVCNPGSIKLPIDLRASLNFNISMGLHSVLKEQYINEGIMNTISNGYESVLASLSNLGKRCINISSNIKSKSIDLINKRIKRFKKSISIDLISIDNKNIKINKINCKDLNELKNAINESNNSIIDQINALMKDNYDTIKNINKDYKCIFNSIKII